MSTFLQPPDETLRLEAVRRLELLDTPPEPRFDRIVQAAHRLFEVSMAAISLLDAERQWFKARIGFSLPACPREQSLCHFVLSDRAPVVAEDTLQDPRFAHHPMVQGPPNLRFYAGVPLRSPQGWIVGTLCVAHDRPRTFGPEDRAILEGLGTWAECELLHSQPGTEWIASLQEARARYRGLFQHTSDALFWVEVHPDGSFTYGDNNPAHQHLTGLPNHVLRGRRPDELFPPELASLLEGHYRDAVEARHPIRYEETLDLPGGLRHWSTELVPLFDEAGRVIHLAGISRDLTEHLKLEEENRTLAEMIRRTDNGVILTDATGHVRWVNEGFTRLSGYMPEEIVGHKPGELLQGPDTDPATVSRMARALRAGESFRVEVLNYRKDGQPYWNELEVQPLRNSQGTLTGFIGIEKDITLRKEADRLKEEFLATVSHELRTPLTALQGALGLLLGGATGALMPAQHDLLRVAHQNADRLGHLVNDLLDLQKIESGRMSFDLRVWDLTALSALALETVQPFATTRRVNLRLTPPPTPLLVQVDGDRFQQIAINFLSNAIKYSPPDDTIVLRLVAREDWAWLEVEDHGPGIPETFRPRVFQKFAQAASGNTRIQGGTGLGLSIAKQLTEQMGGRIGFHSVPGRTCFYVGFPRVPEVS